MGKVVYDTGSRCITMQTLDKFILSILILLGIQSCLYYADFWFLGGHRQNMFFFVLLSYAIFRGVVRSIISWYFMLFLHIPRFDKAPAGKTVDVLTTAMPGEPYEMFEKTLAAIGKLSYPHTAYLLDGGNDPALKRLCQSHAITHVDARNIQGAKAGKINFCLQNYAEGEFVVIIDPDHIPEPDFIQRVLPAFTDEKVGFVQVVQPYYNRFESSVAHGAAEQGFGFYGPLMMSLDTLGSAIAIGANCTFRRKALDAINGHAVHLAEDACTSLRIHAKGYCSRYVPYRATNGLVPADIPTYLSQQLKWSAGMFKLFFFEYPRKVWKLKFHQQLYYGFAGTHYLSGLASLLTFVLPILFLFFQIFAIEVPFSEYLLHAIPYMFFSTVITLYLQRWYSSKDEQGFPWRSMLLDKAAWFVYVMGFVFTIVGKKVVYMPTPKNKNEVLINPWIVVPNAAVIVLSIAAIIFALSTYYRIDGGTWLMIFFASVNIASLLPSLLWTLWPLFKKQTVPAPPLQSTVESHG